MDGQIVAVFCLFDDILKALYYQEDCQCWISDADKKTFVVSNF